MGRHSVQFLIYLDVIEVEHSVVKTRVLHHLLRLRLRLRLCLTLHLLIVVLSSCPSSWVQLLVPGVEAWLDLLLLLLLLLLILPVTIFVYGFFLSRVLTGLLLEVERKL